MNRVRSFTAQVLRSIPRIEFEAAVGAPRDVRHARGGKRRHPGVTAAYQRPVVAYANAHRPWELFATVFGSLYWRRQAGAWECGRRKFRFKHKLLSLDATLIPLRPGVLDWA